MKTLKHYFASIAHEFGREEAELMLLSVFKTPFEQRLMLFMKDPLSRGLIPRYLY